MNRCCADRGFGGPSRIAANQRLNDSFAFRLWGGKEMIYSTPAARDRRRPSGNSIIQKRPDGDFQTGSAPTRLGWFQRPSQQEPTFTCNGFHDAGTGFGLKRERVASGSDWLIELTSIEACELRDCLCLFAVGGALQRRLVAPTTKGVCSINGPSKVNSTMLIWYSCQFIRVCVDLPARLSLGAGCYDTRHAHRHLHIL